MYRRFWLCCGIDGCRDSLRWLRRGVLARRPDAVLFAGGLLTPSTQRSTRATPWSLSLGDCRFAAQFFATLGKLKVFSAVIPGLSGEPLEDYARLGMQAELEHPTVHIVHATLVEAGGWAVCGLGGPIAEKQLCGMDSLSRVTAEYALRPLRNARPARKVMLLSVPPCGGLGGPDGVSLVGELIDSYHPDLCVVAGSSQRRGIERVGHTLAVNPGRLADGWAAWLDWGCASADRVQFVNLRELDSEATAPSVEEGTAPRSRLRGAEASHPVATEEDIRRRAYLLWEAAGRPPRDGTIFWRQAEQELAGTCR